MKIEILLLSRDTDINPKRVSADTIERILSKYGVKARQECSMQFMTYENM